MTYNFNIKSSKNNKLGLFFLFICIINVSTHLCGKIVGTLTLMRHDRDGAIVGGN